MAHKKIIELLQTPVSNESVLWLRDLNQPNKFQYVKTVEIFNWIKEAAQNDEGLTVEFTGEQIIFIKGKK